MAGEIDPRIVVASGEFYAGAVTLFLTLGGLWVWVKMSITSSNRRHDGHDKKFEKQDEEIKEINSKLGELATKDDMRDFKADVIREMYTLFASGPSAPLDRRKEPR